MKVQELRIGNIVKIDDEYLGPIEGKVFSLNEKAEVELLLSVNKGNIRYFRCGSDDIFPIPITEELLDNNGFKPYTKEHNAYTLDLDIERRVWMFKNTYGWTLQYVRYGVGYNDVVSKNIVMFVHQLQNAYYLVTGKELEIKL